MASPNSENVTFQHSLEAAARSRFVIPVLIAAGLLAATVNELSYQRSSDALAHGIALTDARVQAAEALQLLTDVGLYARAYLLSNNASDAQRYRETVTRARASKQKTFDLVAALSPGRVEPTGALDQMVTELMTDTTRWVELVERGELEAAKAAAVTNTTDQRRELLRDEFDKLLQSTARVQGETRFSLWQAIYINRLALHFIAIAAVLGLLVFRRQLIREHDTLVEERKLLVQRVRERTIELTQTAQHLVSAREDERTWLARELHDELGGTLTVMKLDLARLRRIPELPEKATERIASLDGRLNEGIALKRRIIENLHPSSLDQLGLVPALELLCTDMAEALQVPVHVELEPISLEKSTELALYRVVQEALTNIGKYAQCSEVNVSLRVLGPQLQLSVRDNGAGFVPSKVPHGHHGLIGMRIRLEAHGGRLHVDSSPGNGTTVNAELPAQS